MEKSHYDVIISGAGPTGLVFANLLKQWDVDFLLIDQSEGPTPASKAFGIHARSIEVFHQIGVASEFIGKGKTDNTVRIIRKGSEVALFCLDNLLPGETRYPHFLILPQNRTEEILLEPLEGQHKKVHWEHELVGFKEKRESLQVDILSNGTVNSVGAKFLIGCDGADSFIRQASNIGFNGKSFSPSFFLADGSVESSLEQGDVYFLLAPYHLSLMFSFPDKNRYRIFNFLNGRKDLKEGQQLTKPQLQKALDHNSMVKIKVKKLEWASVFKIHSRLAESFGKGRIFLAGDAAHIHSPVGGQGMNTGIQDAYNLAWKISLVLKGNAHPLLLSTYHEERYPIARNLHRSTDRMFQLLIRKNPTADFFRQYIFPLGFKLLANITSYRKFVFRRVSQLAVKYRYGSFNKKGFHHRFAIGSPKPGDRAPFVIVEHRGKATDTHELISYKSFTLFLAVKKLQRPVLMTFLNYVRKEIKFPIRLFLFLEDKGTYDFFKKYGIKSEGMYLIRPDGHICFRSSKIDEKELRGYLRGTPLISKI